MRRFLLYVGSALAVVTLVALIYVSRDLDASSHREAPLISTDPLADNTDLYAFRSPDNPSTITIISNFIGLELPEGGPNYANFGENVRYEIYVDNNADNPGDEIIYYFYFDLQNEDPNTFFNIRLGQQNLKATYTAERSTDGGASFTTIVTNGPVPPNNIGERSINGGAGLNTTYDALMQAAIVPATTGEKVFCGPVDDPFFVDLGGIFDLGQTRVPGAPGAEAARDGVAGYNVHAIALQIPITTLQKDGKDFEFATSILDGDFVIGVWSAASRRAVTTINSDGTRDVSGDWVQVSRLGMPLTNEAVIPIGQKDLWNAVGPDQDLQFADYFTNPELGLYMAEPLPDYFGEAIPALKPLRIQTNSLGAFDFRNGKDGLFGLPESARTGTALSDAAFGGILLQDNAPRSVDLLPIFYTGAPNLRPYQLATGKNGDPLAEGKPFINNFLPSLGDKLRLNMAVPPTPRDDPQFSTLGLVGAAVLGLTVSPYKDSPDLEFIPNMDGFPNGRRLEDDVTTIELQAVGGVVLAALGLWYDDYIPGTSPDPLTDDLLGVLGYKSGPTKNDLALKSTFPYMATPHRGYDYIKQTVFSTAIHSTPGGGLGIGPNSFKLQQNYPNPFNPETAIEYDLKKSGSVKISIYNTLGQKVATLYDGQQVAGKHRLVWDGRNDKGIRLATGTYIYQMEADGVMQSKKMLLLK
jgi:hypothetical protein